MPRPPTTAIVVAVAGAARVVGVVVVAVVVRVVVGVRVRLDLAPAGLQLLDWAVHLFSDVFP